MGLLILTTGEWLAQLLSLQEVAVLLLLIPVAMFLAAMQQILTQWLIRKKQYSITARVAVFQSLTINFLKTGVGWFFPIGSALIIVATIGHAIYASLLWLGIKSKPNAQPEYCSISGSSIRTLARRHYDFPLYRAPQVALSSLSLNIPVLLLANFFGVAAVGYYALSKTVIGIPSALISKSVSDVFYPKATEAFNNGETIYKLILHSTAGLAIVGVLPLSVIFSFGPDLFGFVFGDRWAVAGEYARWLSIFMFFNLINSPSVASVSILNRQRWFLFYGLFSAIMRASGLYLGYVLTGDPVKSVAGFSLLGSIAYIYLILSVLHKSRSVSHATHSRR